GPQVENLVRDAGLYEGRQGRLLLQERGQVQVAVRDARLQRQGEPRRRCHVGDGLRRQGSDRRGGEEDPRAREERRQGLIAAWTYAAWTCAPSPGRSGRCTASTPGAPGARSARSSSSPAPTTSTRCSAGSRTT